MYIMHRHDACGSVVIKGVNTPQLSESRLWRPEDHRIDVTIDEN